MKKKKLLLSSVAFYFLSILLVSIVLSILQINVSEKIKGEYKLQLQQKENSIKVLEQKSDSLLNLLHESERKVIILNDSINLLEKQRKTNKKAYEKDLIDIDNNSLDEDIEFFSNWLSSSDSLSR